MTFRCSLFFAFLCLPTAAFACSADVAPVKSEFAGTDVINSFEINKIGETAATVSFDATTRYLHKNHVYTRKSTYSVDVSTSSSTVDQAEKTQQDVDEVLAVEVANVRCTP